MTPELEAKITEALQRSLDFVSWYRRVVAERLIIVTPFALKLKPNDAIVLHDIIAAQLALADAKHHEAERQADESNNRP